MPLYDFKCSDGHRFERFVPLEKFEEPVFCSCHSPAMRLISAPMFSVDKTDYTCPITGKWIGSKRAHEENLKVHGCRVLETGEAEAATQTRAKAEKEFEDRVEETVERELSTWSSDKMEKLSNELLNANADVVVERL